MKKLNIIAKGRKVALDTKNMDLKHRYQLLGRLQSDCNYYLSNPNSKRLWSGDVKSQIKDMKDLFNSFKEEEKPQWITWKDILKYEKEMVK